MRRSLPGHLSLLWRTLPQPQTNLSLSHPGGMWENRVWTRVPRLRAGAPSAPLSGDPAKPGEVGFRQAESGVLPRPRELGCLGPEPCREGWAADRSPQLGLRQKPLSSKERNQPMPPQIPRQLPPEAGALRHPAWGARGSLTLGPVPGGCCSRDPWFFLCGPAPEAAPCSGRVVAHCSRFSQII